MIYNAPMTKKPKQDWRRNGVRVNLYFPDPKTLMRIDRAVKKTNLTRSQFVESAVDLKLMEERN